MADILYLRKFHRWFFKRCCIKQWTEVRLYRSRKGSFLSSMHCNASFQQKRTRMPKKERLLQKWQKWQGYGRGRFLYPVYSRTFRKRVSQLFKKVSYLALPLNLGKNQVYFLSLLQFWRNNICWTISNSTMYDFLFACDSFSKISVTIETCEISVIPNNWHQILFFCSHLCSALPSFSYFPTIPSSSPQTLGMTWSIWLHAESSLHNVLQKFTF